MTAILEKIGKVLQQQALPATERFREVVSEVTKILQDKAQTVAREVGEPSLPFTLPENSADRVENHLYHPVPVAQEGETVSKISRRLAGQPDAFDTVELLFVTDTDRKLLGVVPLSKLLTAAPRMVVDELMNREVDCVNLADHPEQAAKLMVSQQLSAVPVVDDHGGLLGAVPTHALFKTLQDERLQDRERLVGIWRNSDQALSAIEGEPLRRVIDRLPWLIVGTIGCIAATGLMATFEKTLRADLAVAFFIPGIVYLADAIGTQSEAIAVRGLSFSDAPLSRLLEGEIKTGFYLGIALAIVVFPFIWLSFNASLALAVSTALICASSVATGIGLLLPSLLARMRKDPAYGSGPVATIVQDLLSLLIYLSVVSLLFS